MPDEVAADPNGIEAVKTAKTTTEAIPLLAQQYQLLVAPGQIVELRAVKVRRGTGRAPHTEAGFFDFDHLADMARAALEVSPKSQAVYFTLNPLKPELLARRANRIDWAGEGELAKDKDVLARRFLLIDVDPLRDALVSATDEEKLRAWETVLAVREHLDNRSWPAPVLADSGNGYHLLYRIDLPADDGGTVQRILRALAKRFDNDHARIDQTVFNPARICKLPGTKSRKGDSTADRPHRRSCILEAPAP